MDSKSTKESTLNGPHVHLPNVNDYRSLYVSQKLDDNMLVLIIFLKKIQTVRLKLPTNIFFRKLVIE